MTHSPDVISGGFAGRYTIERELGRGGTSIVYLARDVVNGGAVAIKVMRTELITDINTERFLREARVTMGLEHPNIVPVLDSGDWDGRPYFVLPHMTGGTLRDRLRREKQLPVAQVIEIGARIARALQFAHERNFLHRDVKPENILFSATGESCLADFGIARALSRSVEESTTSTGVVRGTPAYMSPEQAAGDHDIDARSDIYSLASVLYEALAGVPTFIGPSSQSVLAQRISRVPPGVRTYRDTVPKAIERVLDRALALAPVDRFQTAEEFAAALEHAPAIIDTAPVAAAPGWRARAFRQRRALIALSAAAVLLASWAAYTARSARQSAFAEWLESIGIIDLALDTSVLAIVTPDTTGSLEAARAIRSRLARWQELSLVDEAATRDAGQTARGATSSEREQKLARSLGAGRYVRVRSTPLGDSADVSAALYDTRSNSRLIEKTIRVRANAGITASQADAIVDTLLFGGDVPRVSRPQGRGGTSSLRARRAFLRGQSALEDGDLVAADSAFFAATRLDPDDAQSLIWLANVRSWTMHWGQHAWGQLTRQAGQAIERRGRVTPPDSALLAALTALDAGRYDLACAGWSRLSELDPYDYAAWYGLANCLWRDPAVLRDRASPSGWRFRTSYERAVRGFEQAFRLRPSVLRGFGGRSLADLNNLLYTTGDRWRTGRAIVPDTGTFVAFPTWQGDSLAFVPVPRDEALAGRGMRPNAVALAIQRQRERFHAITQMWRAESPTSFEAAEALAISLEMLGDAAALDTLGLARAMARQPNDRTRLAASEVLLRLKFSLPSDAAGLSRARTLADSLLGAHSPSDGIEPQLLESLAALSGRANLAASYAPVSGTRARDQVPPAIAQSGPALLVFAALGGPADTLAKLEETIESSIAGLPEGLHDAIRAGWLMRAALLAFPDVRLRTLTTAARTLPSQNPQASLLIQLTGDPEVLRARLRSMARGRSSFRSADLKMEGLLPGAAALASIGDTREAIDWLDPTLGALRLSASSNLADAVQTGTLVRAMVLRARLAERVGDAATARRWARAVVTLWSRADPFLQPVVRDMQRLAR